jgi:hypothetical protein
MDFYNQSYPQLLNLSVQSQNDHFKKMKNDYLQR